MLDPTLPLELGPELENLLVRLRSEIRLLGTKQAEGIPHGLPTLMATEMASDGAHSQGEIRSAQTASAKAVDRLEAECFNCNLATKVGALSWRHLVKVEMASLFATSTREDAITEAIEVAAVCLMMAMNLRATDAAHADRSA